MVTMSLSYSRCKYLKDVSPLSLLNLEIMSGLPSSGLETILNLPRLLGTAKESYCLSHDRWKETCRSLHLRKND